MDENQEIESLRKELRALLEEREMLLGAQEDIELLAMVSNKVSVLADKGEILDKVLESICILKDLSYASFFERHGNSYQITREYKETKLASKLNQTVHKKDSPDLVRADKLGGLETEQFVQPQTLVPFPTEKFATKMHILLPVTVLGEKIGFIAVCDFSDKSRPYKDMRLLFERVAATTSARIESLHLMRDIKNLNAEIREKYALRGIELKFSEERYQSLVEDASDAIITSNLEGRITSWNRSAAKMFGYSLDEVIGKPIKELMPKRLWPEQKNLLGQINKGDEVHGWETTRLAKDGTEVPVEMSLSKIKDQLGKPVGICAVIRNITERRQTERLQREKEQNIRKAYADTLSAYTGGRLVILTADEMAESFGKPITDIVDFYAYKDLSEIRASIARVMTQFFPDTALSNLVLATSEALTNAIKHASKGKFQIRKRNGVLQVVVSDNGPGIDFAMLPKATLMTGFSTKPSLGLGFTIMLDTCDRVLLTTQPRDTRIVLEWHEEKSRARSLPDKVSSETR